MRLTFVVLLCTTLVQASIYSQYPLDGPTVIDTYAQTSSSKVIALGTGVDKMCATGASYHVLPSDFINLKASNGAPTGNSDFSTAGYVKAVEYGKRAFFTIGGTDKEGNVRGNWGAWVYADNQGDVSVVSGGFSFATGTRMVLDRWYHFVLTYSASASEMNLWVDGVVVLTESVVMDLKQNSRYGGMAIGEYHLGGSPFARHGEYYIDHVTFADHVMEVSEAWAPCITHAPPTDAPPTKVPETAVPTLSPPTPAPDTSAPLTSAPPTSAPPTSAPPTSAPPTIAPDTSAPPTDAPETPAPPTPSPPTSAPPTPSPPTDSPPTPAPSTDSPPTSAPPPGATFRVTTSSGKGSYGSVASFAVFIHLIDATRTAVSPVHHPDAGEVRIFEGLSGMLAKDIAAVEFRTTHPDGWKIRSVELWTGVVWETLVLPHHGGQHGHWIDVADSDNKRAPGMLLFARDVPPLAPGAHQFSIRATTGSAAGDGSVATFAVRLHFNNARFYDVPTGFASPTGIETLAVTTCPLPLSDVDHIEISDPTGVDSWTVDKVEVGVSGVYSAWILPAQGGRYGHVLDRTQANDAAVELRYYAQPSAPAPGTTFTIAVRITMGTRPAMGSTNAFTVTATSLAGETFTLPTLTAPGVGEVRELSAAGSTFPEADLEYVRVTASGSDDTFLASVEVRLNGVWTRHYLRDFALNPSRWICGACAGMVSSLVYVAAPTIASVTEPHSAAAGTQTVNIRFTTGSKATSGSSGSFRIGLHSNNGVYYRAGEVVAPGVSEVRVFSCTSSPIAPVDVLAVYVFHGGDEGWEIAKMEIEKSSGYVSWNVNGAGSHWVDGNDLRTMGTLVWTP